MHHLRATFEQARAASSPLALATLIETRGSTYRLAPVQYDLIGEEELLWGLGLGCAGAMDIRLTRLVPGSSQEPFRPFSATT